jgi:hypothetical protein
VLLPHAGCWLGCLLHAWWQQVLLLAKGHASRPGTSEQPAHTGWTPWRHRHAWQKHLLLLTCRPAHLLFPAAACCG